MSYATREQIAVTTIADGTATAYSTGVFTGRVMQIKYTKDGTTPYADGVDFTITAETSGVNVWVQQNVNATATVCPRQATHGTDGTAALYAAAGTAVNDYVWLVQERLKIVLAQGGDTKTGTFSVVIG